jgi:hypothetical protein
MHTPFDMHASVGQQQFTAEEEEVPGERGHGKRSGELAGWPLGQ